MHRLLAICAVILALTTAALADDMLVKKRVFAMPELTTIGGKTIKAVRVGWESYGTLNADKSNAILIAHFFSASSHAAGKYAATDKAPGYWDALIGPGKAIDTNKYYVLSVDSLVNLNTADPNVTTTGPATIDPATGKPYGMSFPVVTIGDFVRVQKALVDSLGITKLHAVMGASMGGLQTYEWAATYPDSMERIIPVIAAADPGPWLTEWLNLWAAPILLDPHWNHGDYYGHEPPLAGLAQSLKLVSLQANQAQWAEKTFSGAGGGSAWADPARNPLDSFDNHYKIETALDAAGAARAANSDANHLLYLVKANQTFVPGAGAGAASPAEGIKRIKVPALILYSPADEVFLAPWIAKTAEAIRANGVPVEMAEIAGPYGHLNGVLALAPLGGRIAEFLAR
jgi:homoserine O-acetyltransferase